MAATMYSLSSGSYWVRMAPQPLIDQSVCRKNGRLGSAVLMAKPGLHKLLFRLCFIRVWPALLVVSASYAVMIAWLADSATVSWWRICLARRWRVMGVGE